MTTSSTKTRALCVATRCTSVEQFVATFHRFCGDDQTFFVATMTSRPIGLETPFSIQLADKQPVLRGMCIVLDAWETPENRYRRPGIRLGIKRLTADSQVVFDRLQAASRSPANSVEATPPPGPLPLPSIAAGSRPPGFTRRPATPPPLPPLLAPRAPQTGPLPPRAAGTAPGTSGLGREAATPPPVAPLGEAKRPLPGVPVPPPLEARPALTTVTIPPRSPTPPAVTPPGLRSVMPVAAVTPPPPRSMTPPSVMPVAPPPPPPALPRSMTPPSVPSVLDARPAPPSVPAVPSRPTPPRVPTPPPPVAEARPVAPSVPAPPSRPTPPSVAAQTPPAPPSEPVSPRPIAVTRFQVALHVDTIPPPISDVEFKPIELVPRKRAEPKIISDPSPDDAAVDAAQPAVIVDRPGEPPFAAPAAAPSVAPAQVAASSPAAPAAAPSAAAADVDPPGEHALPEQRDTLPMFAALDIVGLAAADLRTPGSALVLPANPLQDLSDESIEGFVDCTLYEETENIFHSAVDGPEWGDDISAAAAAGAAAGSASRLPPVRDSVPAMPFDMTPNLTVRALGDTESLSVAPDDPALSRTASGEFGSAVPVAVAADDPPPPLAPLSELAGSSSVTVAEDLLQSRWVSGEMWSETVRRAPQGAAPVASPSASPRTQPRPETPLPRPATNVPLDLGDGPDPASWFDSVSLPYSAGSPGHVADLSMVVTGPVDPAAAMDRFAPVIDHAPPPSDRASPPMMAMMPLDHERSAPRAPALPTLSMRAAAMAPGTAPPRMLAPVGPAPAGPAPTGPAPAGPAMMPAMAMDPGMAMPTDPAAPATDAGMPRPMDHGMAPPIGPGMAPRMDPATGYPMGAPMFGHAEAGPHGAAYPPVDSARHPRARAADLVTLPGRLGGGLPVWQRWALIGGSVLVAIIVAFGVARLARGTDRVAPSTAPKNAPPARPAHAPPPAHAAPGPGPGPGSGSGSGSGSAASAPSSGAGATGSAGSTGPAPAHPAAGSAPARHSAAADPAPAGAAGADPGGADATDTTPEDDGDAVAGGAPVVGSGPCRVTVATTPAGSVVRLDDQAVGPSPITIECSCDKHKIDISHARYQSVTRSLTLAADQPQALDISLPRPIHAVTVTSFPPGAELSIDGHRAGTTPTVVQMTGFATVNLTFTKAGFQSVTRKVYSKAPQDRVFVKLMK